MCVNNTIPIELHARKSGSFVDPKMPDYRGSIVVKTHFDCNILVSVPRDIIFTEILEI